MSKQFGRYLRTNYKITGRELDSDAIGEAIIQGSWGGGVGTKRWCGGFIMGSFNSTAYSAIHPISAAGAIAEYYGSAPGWSDVTGFKIFPIMIKNASIPYQGTASVGYEFHWSVSGSIFWVIGIKRSAYLISVSTASGPVDGVASLLASNESIHFVWAGFIVSGPT